MSYYKRQRADDLFVCVKVYLPKSTVDTLKLASNSKGIPMSRLCAISVDNELDTGKPFTYDTDWSKVPYKEYMYASEAAALLKFLQKVPNGIAADSLVLCRADVGIPDKVRMLGALRELFDKEMIEEYTPTKTIFKYGIEYKRIRMVGADERLMRKSRFKTLEGDKQIGITTDDDIERGE